MRQFFRYVFILFFTIVAGTSYGSVVNSGNTGLSRFENENFEMEDKTANDVPDATITGTGSGTTYNGVPVFETCTNTTTLFTFTNASTTISTNAKYTITWGDGAPDFVAASWTTTSHTYKAGLWNLVYKVDGSDGSTITKAYIVFVGSTPAVIFGAPANTDICNPTTLTFSIGGTRNNPLGTTYTVTYTDGSAPEVYNHPPPTSVSHTFTKPSCGTMSATYPNSYSATMLASNPCGNSTVVVAPIYVSTAPVVDFTIPVSVSCINSPVCMTNTTPTGTIADPAGCLNPNVVWSISPATGFTLTSGTLGNDFGSAVQSTWSSGSNQICPSFTTPGTYTITLKVGNKCGIDQKTKTICVETPIVPQFSLVQTANCKTLDVTVINSTVTTNACNATVYNWDVSYSAGYCGTAPAYLYTNGTSSTSKNPSFQFVNPGTYTIRLSISNSCGTQSASQSVIVEQKPPTAVINSIPDFCGSASVTPSAVVTNCAPPSSPLNYTWSFPGGVPTTANTQDPGTITYSSVGSYTVSLNITNACGVSVTATKSFSVKQVPVLTNTVLSQAICSGEQTDLVTLIADIPGTTFSWIATGTAGISGFTASGTSNTIPQQTILNANNFAGTITYAITPDFGGCSGSLTNYVVTVNPVPVFTSQPVSSTVCRGATSTQLSVSFNYGSSPVYQWYANTVDNNTSGNLIPGTNSATYDPPTTTVGTVYYYCIVTFPTATCSSITSNTANVTVTAIPLISIQPTPSQGVCIGGALQTPLTFSYVGGTGNVSYQWYSNTSNSNIGGTSIFGATNTSYTPPVFTIAGNYYYYAELTFSGSGCNKVLTNIAIVNVVTDPIVSAQPLVTQTVCQNSDPVNLNLTATGGVGSYFYQWYENPVNNTTSGTLIAGATGATYKPVTSILGTNYYYCLITQAAGLGCEVTSNTAEVKVVSPPTISSQPVSSTVCQGGTPTTLSVSYVNGVGVPTYQWYGNIADDTANGILIPGATNSTYVPTSTTIGSFFYYCIISLSSGTCSSITSNTANVVVNAAPAINVQPSPTQDICIGGTIASPLIVNYTGGTGAPTYQWYSNVTNSNSGGTVIPSAVNSSYMPPVFTTVGTYYYYVVLTFSGSGCSSALSNVAAVNVLPDPTISIQPLLTQTVCQNSDPIDLSVTAGGGLNIFYYQWYQNTVNNATTGTLIAAAKGATYKPVTTTVSTSYYYCMISQGTGLGCEVTSNISEVKVVSPPTFSTQPAPDAVCQGGTSATLSVTYVNGVGVPNYQWYVNTVDNTASGTLISGATNSTYIPLTTSIGSFYYYCIINFPSGSCTSVTSNTANVLVNAVPTVNVQPTPTQDICIGGTITAPLTVNYTGGTGTPTYQWYSNTVNANSGGTAISGAVTSSYMPAVFTTAGTYYYYAILTFSVSGCSSAVSDVTAVNVLLDPTIGLQPIASQTLCQNSDPADLKVTASGGLNIFYYQWYQNTVNNKTTGTLIPGAAGATYKPITTTVGTSYYYCVISQGSGLGCEVISETAEVIVVPALAFTNQPVSSTICEGDVPAVLSVTYVNGVGVPTYQWYSNTVNSSVGGTVIAGATNATYAPPAITVGTVYYYCTITLPPGGGCTNITSSAAQITVNQKPAISNKNIPECSNDAFVVIPDNSTGDIVPVGTLYSWSYPVMNPVGSISGATAQPAPQASISQTLVNNSLAIATATYIVTPISGVCAGTNFNVVVTVNPAIKINPTVNNITCFAANNGSIQTNILGGTPYGFGAPYFVSWSGPNGFTSSSANISGLIAGDYVLSVTDAAGCIISNSYSIVEPAAITITKVKQKNVSCFGTSNGEITISVSGGTSPYNYAWTKNNVAFATTKDLSNLGPGLYEVTVSDINNCAVATASYTIVEPSILGVTLVSKTNVLCYGDATGAITVNVFGGTPNQVSPGVFDYAYLWMGPNGFSSSNRNLSNLVAGTYNLIVADFSGCSKNLSVIITQSSEIVIDTVTTPITCYGDNNASISLSVSGGNAPYQIQWSNSGTGTFQNNLAAGNYTITVTDNIGCTKTMVVNIPEALIYNINPVVKNISCHGANDGIINLNFVGGKPPVSVVWNDAPTSATLRTNLAPGTYTVTISDGKPCFINNSFVITEPLLLVLSANTTDAVDCNGANSGAINLTVAGGTSPYTIIWSNGATTEDLVNIPAGTYSVTVTDANNCVQTAQYTIARPLPLEINVTSIDGYNCTIQKAVKTSTATVTGGVPPYQLTWSRGTASGSNNEIMETYQNGLVNLDVVDALGCSKNYSFNVSVIKLGIDYIVSDCNARDYEFYALVLDDQDYHNCTWDFGDGTSSNLMNPKHTFPKAGSFNLKLTVESSTCTAVFQQTLIVEARPVLSLDREPKLCFGDSVNLHALGANFYRWNDGTTADSIWIKQAGDYSLIGRTITGCLDTLYFTASYYDAFNYTIQTDRNEVSTDGAPLHIWSEGIPYSHYYWDFGDSITTDQNYDVYHTYAADNAGHYDIKLKVINPNGCTEYATKRIWITNNSDVNTFSPKNDGNDFMKGWHVQIYNRNGLLIFEGMDGWPGTYHGKTVSADTYFYVVYNESESGTKSRTGYVTVIR